MEDEEEHQADTLSAVHMPSITNAALACPLARLLSQRRQVGSSHNHSPQMDGCRFWQQALCFSANLPVVCCLPQSQALALPFKNKMPHGFYLARAIPARPTLAMLSNKCSIPVALLVPAWLASPWLSWLLA